MHSEPAFALPVETDFWSLVGILVLLAVVPGPSDFAVAARSLAHGFRHGVWMVVGILSADMGFILLTLVGVDAGSELFAPNFQWLSLAGGFWLIILGMNSIRTLSSEITDLPQNQSPRLGAKGGFTAGFLITISDPKALFFYFSLVPSFLLKEENPWRFALPLVSVVTLAVAIIKLGYAAFAARISRWQQTKKRRQFLNILGAIVLIGIGVLLLWRAIQS